MDSVQRLDETQHFMPVEQMVVCASRTIQDKDVVYFGTGIPVAASFLAKYLHAPNATIMFETGAIRTTLCALPFGVDTLETQARADYVADGFYVNSLAQRGRVDLGFMGAGQVDRFGNTNSTAVGSYEQPILRYPGGGGACEVASLCKRVVILLKQNKPRFPDRVDYITGPGYLDGKPGSRERAGLPPDTGPAYVITDMAKYRFEDRDMVVESIHKNSSVDQINANVGWDIKLPKDVQPTVIPTSEELEVLRKVVDPEGALSGGRLM